MNNPPCPSCQQPLMHAISLAEGSTHIVWCGYGPCKSLVSNDGAEGETFEEAFTVLRRRIEEEEEI